jgi:iron complex outermembrane receptor protein
MFRKIFFLFLFIGSTSSLFGQAKCTCTLEGNVRMADSQELIPGASVYLKGLNKGVSSDQKGHFSLKNICPGTYTLVCQMSSFERTEIQINITEEHTLEQNFSLQNHDEHLQEVFVTGKKTESSAQLQGKLTDEERKERDGLSLGEMMKGMTGVQSLQTGSSLSKPVIHGMHSARVVILNQGIRQEGQQWGSEHAPEIDPFVSKNIQIIKGPAGLRYGGDAIGGIILLNPDPLPDTAGIKGEVQSILFSNGQQAVLSGSLSGGIPGANGWGWRAQGTLKDGGNIQTANYYLANTGVKEQNFSLHTGYKASNWGSDFFYSYFHSVIGIYLGSHIGNVNDLENAIKRSRPNPIFTPENFNREINRPNQDVTHQLAKWKAYYTLTNGSAIRTTLANQQDQRLELDVLRAGKSINTLQFLLGTWNGEFIFDETNSSKIWKGQWGLNFQLQENITSGNRVKNPTLTSSLLPNYFQNNIGIFAIERKVTPTYELDFGIRADLRNIETHRPRQNYSKQIERGNRDYHGISGSLGFKYFWSKFIENHIMLARAYRAPGANELFSYGVHHGAASFEIGDPNLKGETAYNFSLNTIFSPQNLQIEIGLFHNYIQDFIYLRPLVERGNAVYFSTVRGAFPGFAFEEINAIFQGMDAQANYQISANWSFQQKTSIVHAFDTKHNNRYLVNIPANRFDYLVRYAWMENKQYISAGITHVAQQTRVEPGSDYAAPPKGYALVQLNWGIQWKQVDVGIRVSNALNTAYRDYLNRFRYFTDDQGRNISLRANVRF